MRRQKSCFLPLKYNPKLKIDGNNVKYLYLGTKLSKLSKPSDILSKPINFSWNMFTKLFRNIDLSIVSKHGFKIKIKKF